MRLVATLALVLSTLCAAELEAQIDSEDTRMTLAGLSGVGFAIALQEHPSCASVAESDLRTAGESALQQNDINVIPNDQLTSEEGWPHLQLVVNIVLVAAGDDQIGCAYSIELGLLQSATLWRNQDIVAAEAMTWRAIPKLGVAGMGSYPESVVGAVSGQFDEFVKAFLAAN